MPLNGRLANLGFVIANTTEALSGQGILGQLGLGLDRRSRGQGLLIYAATNTASTLQSTQDQTHGTLRPADRIPRLRRRGDEPRRLAVVDPGRRGGINRCSFPTSSAVAGRPARDP